MDIKIYSYRCRLSWRDTGVKRKIILGCQFLQGIALKEIGGLVAQNGDCHEAALFGYGEARRPIPTGSRMTPKELRLERSAFVEEYH